MNTKQLVSIVFFLFTSFHFVLFAQKRPVPISSASKSMDYDQLVTLLENSKNQKEGFGIAQIIIQKAKEENNIEQLNSGYSAATFYAIDDDTKLKYVDSLTTIAIKSKDDLNIGMAYENAAQIHIQRFDYAKATDASLISYDYLKKLPEKEYAENAKILIGRMKYAVGNLKEAKEILTASKNYFKNALKSDPDTSYKFSYANSLIMLVRINSKLGFFSENEAFLKEINSFARTNDDVFRLKPGVLAVEGFNAYYQNKFAEAISKIERSLKDFNDSENHFVEKFYLGMSYWKLGEYEKALPYFTEIEQDYDIKGRTSIEFRPMFEFFMDYYKRKGDDKKQLTYIEKLLNYDQNLKKEQGDITQRISKEFDDIGLLEEKQKILGNQKKERIFFASVIALLVLSFILWYFYNKKRKIEKISLKIHNHEKGVSDTNSFELVKSSTFQYEPATNTTYEDYLPINRQTVDFILNKLQEFEKENKFLIPDIRLVALAEQFSTNDKYLSKVIRVSRGKAFNDYINDLKFNYLNNWITTNPEEIKLMKIKDISNTLGYSSPVVFTKLFTEKMGTSPSSYFSNIGKTV